MSDVRVEINSDGIRELLHEVGATVCAEQAQRIADECGDGFRSDVYNAGGRTVASVYVYDSEDPDEILRHLI